MPALIGLTIFALMVVAAFAWAGDQSSLPAPWAWLGPSQHVTALVAVAIVGAAFATYARPRRREGLPWALVAIVGLATIAVLLGLGSVANCLEFGDVLGALWHTMILFVGTSPAVFDEGAVCAGGVPLATQVARFAAMAAVFGTALALAASMAANQVDRMLNRWRHFDEVVVGVDPQSLPLIRSLVDWSNASADGSRREVVVLSMEGQDQAAATARQIGARVFSIVTEPGADLAASTDNLNEQDVAMLAQVLTPYLTAHGRATVHRIWIMDPDVEFALALRQAVHKVIAAVRNAPDQHARPVRVVVRSDDASALPHLRSDFIDDAAQAVTLDSNAPVVLDDAICLHEITAAQVVGRVARSMDSSDYALVVCGDTPLAQAVLTEVALRRWETNVLNKAWAEHRQRCEHSPRCGLVVPGDSSDNLLIGGFMPNELVVIAPTAAALAAAVSVGLAPECGGAPPGEKGEFYADLSIITEDWRQFDATRIPENMDLAFVLTEELTGEDAHLPARLASTAPGRKVRTWVRSDSGEHRAWSLRDPNCEGYADDVLLRDSLPDDLWTRIGRLSHEAFRRRYYAPGDEFRLPWWSASDESRLPSPWRDDNIDQVRHLLVNISRAGFKWVRRQDVSSEAPSQQEWAPIREAEHDRWCQLRKSMDWKWGATKDSHASPPTHPDLRKWKDVDQEKVKEQLNDLMTLLKIHGYTTVRR